MHGGTMGLFHSFNSQEERRKCGGSDYIELQYCRFPVGTETKKIISVNRIRHWENDSLYVYGEDSPLFYACLLYTSNGGNLSPDQPCADSLRHLWKSGAEPD